MSDEWASFFGTLSQVSVTIFGLMFVALQVRSAVWRGRPLLSIAAISALAEVFVPVVVGLVATMGARPWRVAAVVAGAGGLTVLASHAVIYRRARQGPPSGQPSSFDRKQALGGLLSLAVYTGIVVAGLLPAQVGLYTLAGLSTWLLFSGSFEAWWLLEP